MNYFSAFYRLLSKNKVIHKNRDENFQLKNFRINETFLFSSL